MVAVLEVASEHSQIGDSTQRLAWWQSRSFGLNLVVALWLKQTNPPLGDKIVVALEMAPMGAGQFAFRYHRYHGVLTMQFVEADSPPKGAGKCSDNACPCPEVILPHGTGYLYLDAETVEFRRRYPSVDEARRAVHERLAETAASTGARVIGTYRLGGILVCEQGARRRDLDLDVAAADASHWWRTGQIPLRATPVMDQRTAPKTPATPEGLVQDMAEVVGQQVMSYRPRPLAGIDLAELRDPTQISSLLKSVIRSIETKFQASEKLREFGTSNTGDIDALAIEMIGSVREVLESAKSRLSEKDPCRQAIDEQRDKLESLIDGLVQHGFISKRIAAHIRGAPDQQAVKKWWQFWK